MKKVFNEVTKQEEIQFNGTLISLNTEKRFENTNGKGFHLGVLRFKNAQGKPTEASCSVWESVVTKGIEVGGSYLATAQKAADGNIYIHCSNLVGASMATATDFGFTGSQVAVAAPVEPVKAILVAEEA